jgi:hypothetical protein
LKRIVVGFSTSLEDNEAKKEFEKERWILKSKAFEKPKKIFCLPPTGSCKSTKTRIVGIKLPDPLLESVKALIIRVRVRVRVRVKSPCKNIKKAGAPDQNS